MAKQELPVNYKDDVLDTSMGGRRRYNLIQNDDGTVSFEDVTEYTQTGDNYGAAQLNASNKAINESVDKAKVIDSLDDIAANTQPGMVAGALAVSELNGNLGQNAAIGQYGSPWNITTAYKNVGSKMPVVNNDFYETVSGNDAEIKIKKPGTYLLLASSEFGASAGTGGTAWDSILDDYGAEIMRANAYVYGGSATVNIAYLLTVDSPINLKLCVSCSVGSGTIQNKGRDIFQCVKIK